MVNGQESDNSIKPEHIWKGFWISCDVDKDPDTENYL